MLIGFCTYHGTVTARRDWGGSAERKRVKPGLPGSYEALFHDTGLANFLLSCATRTTLARAGSAVACSARSASSTCRRRERASHYFHASLPHQFDAMIHLDETRALAPLDAGPGWIDEDAPETFPEGV